MTLYQLENIIRASGSVTDENVMLVLGSQSILGAFPEPPGDLCVSMEADIFPLKAPQKTDLISGSIGEITLFQSTFGYYAHGLPPEACPLPEGWDTRLHSIKSENTRGVLGLCLDPLDLAASKLVAGRDKDISFVGELLSYGLIDRDALVYRIAQFNLKEHSDRASLNLTITLGKISEPPIGNGGSIDLDM